MKSGGFAQIGHSEDVHTGVNLLKVGYRTVYVPIIVAKGLCPDGLAGFISQQYRWCAGSMSLLVDKSFHAAPLTFRQRLCFYTGFGYYISTAAGVFLLSLPTVIMLWVYPQNVHLANFFWMAPTLMLYPFIRVIHKSGWSPAVLRVTMISSFSHALAIWHVLRGRPADWVPTGNAKRTPLATTVMTVAVVWELTFNLLQLAGIVRFLVDGRSPISAAPIIVFSVLNASVWLPVIVLIFQQNFRVPRRSTVVAARPRQPVFVPPQREASLLEGSDGVVAGRSSWAMLAGAERAAEG
jgi:cellulose synthase (UDP-forming)